MKVDPSGKGNVLSCSSCGGVWVDANSVSSATGKNSTFLQYYSVMKKPATSMTCPSCSKPLMEATITHDDNTLVLDYCAGCKGIYFDRGEVEVFLSIERRKPEVTSSNEGLMPFSRESGDTFRESSGREVGVSFVLDVIYYAIIF